MKRQEAEKLKWQDPSLTRLKIKKHARGVKCSHGAWPPGDCETGTQALNSCGVGSDGAEA